MKTAHRDWRLAVKREGTLGCTHNDREGCLWMGFDPQLGDSVYLGIEQGRAEQSRAELQQALNFITWRVHMSGWMFDLAVKWLSPS